MHHGVLPTMDKHLALFQRWLTDRLSAIEEEAHRQVVERFKTETGWPAGVVAFLLSMVSVISLRGYSGNGCPIRRAMAGGLIGCSLRSFGSHARPSQTQILSSSRPGCSPTSSRHVLVQVSIWIHNGAERSRSTAAGA